MTDVCVVGSFMTDLIAYAPRRPHPGETLRGDDFSLEVGGKGFNQAVASARLGANTCFVGRLGTDAFGDLFRSALDAEGIDARWVMSDADHGTGVGLPVVESNGQNSIIIVPRANDAVTPEQILRAHQPIENARVLLLQLELPLDAAMMAARLAREAHTTVVLNPAPYQDLPRELLDLVDIIIPNEGEAQSLLGVGSSSEESVTGPALARSVHAVAGCTSVVTLGEHGIAIAGPDGELTIPAHTVTPVDTVGAGDTFCGALGAELARGAPLIEAARFANAAAALAVTTRGGAGSTPHRAGVESLLVSSTEQASC